MRRVLEMQKQIIISLFLLTLSCHYSLMAASASLDGPMDIDKEINTRLASISKVEEKERLTKSIHETLAKVKPEEHRAIFEQTNRMLPMQDPYMMGDIIDALCSLSSDVQPLFEPHAVRLMEAMAPNYRTTALLSLAGAPPTAYESVVAHSLRLLTPSMHDYDFSGIVGRLVHDEAPAELVETVLRFASCIDFDKSAYNGPIFYLMQELIKIDKNERDKLVSLVLRLASKDMTVGDCVSLLNFLHSKPFKGTCEEFVEDANLSVTKDNLCFTSKTGKEGIIMIGRGLS